MGKFGNFVVVAGLVAGCADDGGSGEEQAGELGAVTYNLGLLSAVGFVDQRAPLAIAAVSELPADLLCVQEVWEQAHWDELAAANAETRPHTLRLDPDPGVEGMCDADTFNPLQTCAEAACSGDPNLVACVTDACPEEVATLSGGCIQCLVGNASSGDFGAIRETCLGTGSGGDTSDPEQRSYVSGGSYGIGLLSSHPLAETEEKKLDASTVRRAILYARLDDTAIGSVHVFCTHLTAILSNLSYEGSYGGWTEENAAHVKALRDFVDEKTDEGDKVLVLGDLNTGPEGEGITASAPENFALLPASGFDAPFLSGPDAACTFCADNPLVLSEDSGKNAAIDHILTRGIEAPVTVERVLDTLVTIEAESDGNTEEIAVGLSDHYGLRAVIEE